jgi:hypothetical protein
VLGIFRGLLLQRPILTGPHQPVYGLVSARFRKQLIDVRLAVPDADTLSRGHLLGYGPRLPQTV